MNIPTFAGALCKSIGVEMFFADEDGEYFALEQVRRICNGCPARFTCMEWALKHENEGIWAGTTPIQRRKLRRQVGITLERIEPRKYVYVA